MTAHPKRIFYVLPHLEDSVFEDRRYHRIYRECWLVNRSCQEGWDCRLYLPSHVQSSLTLEDDIRTRLVPTDARKPHNRFGHTSRALLSEINEQRPDLVVFKGLGYRLAHWLVLRSRHRFRIGFIAAGINAEPLLPFADYVLAETPQQIDGCFAVAQAAGRAGILPKLPAPAPSRPDAEKIFDIINIGSFTPNKNQRALLPLSTRYRVALLGDGPLWREIHDMTTSCHGSIFMPGNLPREEVAKALAQSRLMVHTALQEGLPRVVMEAFAHGVPVIGSKDAMPGAFEDGVQGLLVKQEHILDAARELLSDPSRLQQMGEAARAYARAHCSEAAVWAAAQKMYDTVLQQPPVFRGTPIDRARLLADVAKRNTVEWLARYYRKSGAKKLILRLKSTP